MKKLFAVVLTIAISLLMSAYADNGELHQLFAPMLATDYVKWENEFGVNDIDLNYTYSDEPDENNQKMLTVDDIAIFYDNAEMCSSAVLLFYFEYDTRAVDIVEQWKKAASMFCAIEYGDPWVDGTDITIARDSADKFITELNDIMRSKQDELMDGEYVVFHTSIGRGHANCVYYLSYNTEYSDWIIYVQ